jgi:hypothetical protein
MLFQIALNGSRLGLYPTFERAFRAVLGSDAAAHSTSGAQLSVLYDVLPKALAGSAGGVIGAFIGSPLFLVRKGVLWVSFGVLWCGVM